MKYSFAAAGIFYLFIPALTKSQRSVRQQEHSFLFKIYNGSGDGGEEDNPSDTLRLLKKRMMMMMMKKKNKKKQEVVEVVKQELQPKSFNPRVIRVDQEEAKRSIGSLSMPNGSPWCGGRPTYWLVGHDPDEYPYCLDENGDWVADKRAKLDLNDAKNKQKGRVGLDRHDCVAVDVNKDGIPDIACFVGAGKAHMEGYTELYLTHPDGTVSKVQDHGLQQYPSLSTRIAVKLKHATGADLIFVGTSGTRRQDKETNAHRMFIALRSGEPPYFVELTGPWIRHYDAIFGYAADLNGDGLDDFIVCEKDANPHMYIQNMDGSFREVRVTNGNRHIDKWRSVRVGYVTGSERPDLVVTVGSGNDPAYVRIFQSKLDPPFFKINNPYFSLSLPHAAPDLEILDVNGDGRKDIYVTQADESQGYCGARGKDIYQYWQHVGGDRRINRQGPSKSWKPPYDEASDLLLVGEQGDSSMKPVFFREINMAFHGRGCGGAAIKFGDDQTLILPRGRRSHSGFDYLLEWGEPTMGTTAFPVTESPTTSPRTTRSSTANPTYTEVITMSPTGERTAAPTSRQTMSAQTMGSEDIMTSEPSEMTFRPKPIPTAEPTTIAPTVLVEMKENITESPTAEPTDSTTNSTHDQTTPAPSRKKKGMMKRPSKRPHRKPMGPKDGQTLSPTNLTFKQPWEDENDLVEEDLPPSVLEKVQNVEAKLRQEYEQKLLEMEYELSKKMQEQLQKQEEQMTQMLLQLEAKYQAGSDNGSDEDTDTDAALGEMENTIATLKASLQRVQDEKDDLYAKHEELKQDFEENQSQVTNEVLEPQYQQTQDALNQALMQNQQLIDLLLLYQSKNDKQQEEEQATETGSDIP